MGVVVATQTTVTKQTPPEHFPSQAKAKNKTDRSDGGKEDAASAIQSAWNSHHRQDADQTKVKAPKGVEESGLAAGSVRQTPTQMDKKKKPKAKGTQKTAPPDACRERRWSIGDPVRWEFP